ncbi:hypothetical protein RFI_20909, partial [Reticulomyxa filosa]
MRNNTIIKKKTVIIISKNFSLLTSAQEKKENSPYTNKNEFFKQYKLRFFLQNCKFVSTKVYYLIGIIQSTFCSFILNFVLYNSFMYIDIKNNLQKSLKCFLYNVCLFIRDSFALLVSSPLPEKWKIDAISTKKSNSVRIAELPPKINLRFTKPVFHEHQEQINIIEQEALKIFQEQKRLAEHICTLDKANENAINTIEDFFGDIIQLLKLKNKQALDQVNQYAQEKKMRIVAYSQQLQFFLQQTQEKIKIEPVLFNLDPQMSNFDVSINIQLRHNYNKFFLTFEQLIEQQLAIIEKGSVQLNISNIQKRSDSKQLVSLQWHTKNVIEGNGSLELEMSSCNGDKDNKQCTNVIILKLIVMKKDKKFNGIIRIKYKYDYYILCINNHFVDSQIVKNEEISTLKTLLPKKYTETTLFKFHEKCNGKAPTVVLVLSEFAHVFGAYTEVKWCGRITENVVTHDPYAFIFLLRNTDNSCQKFAIQKEYVNNTISSGRTHGPIFGEGPDIFISDKCNTNAHFLNIIL